MPLIPSRAQTFASAPMQDILYVVLRQLRRPLLSKGVDISDAEAQALATARLNGQPLARPELLPALAQVIEESEVVLAGLGLTYLQSLATDMNTLGGWETTADFIELAERKSNAELRITLAAGMALAYGDERRCLPYLLYTASGDYGDETSIAYRCLCFAAGVDPAAPDALHQSESRLQTQTDS
jgi:hypothetical protein